MNPGLIFIYQRARVSTMSMLSQDLQDLTRFVRPHFKKGFLHQRQTIFQFSFKDQEPFYLTVESDNFSFEPGIHDTPTMTLFIENHETAFQLLRGTIDGMRAFIEGKYRADGNIVLSQLLLYLFKPDDPTDIYLVMD
jgi:putative sterol carrier protein